MTRGIKAQVDRWVEECSKTYWAYGPADTQVQLAMRPIQLWEIVFPKAHLQSVLATIGGSNIDSQNFSKRMIGLGLRQMLGADKMPEFDLKGTPIKVQVSKDVSGAEIVTPAVNPFCVGIDWIGTREETIWSEGQFKGYEQL